MYLTHNPPIRAIAQSGADGLAKVITMVSLSIQQPWHKVGQQLNDVGANGATSRYLWGMKAQTYAHLRQHKDSIYNAYLNAGNDAEKLMHLFMSIDGLGMVKAGFVCQLAAGLVGCMDSHNIKRLHLNPATLRVPRTISDTLKAKRVSAYIDLCHTIGTGQLWDDWCNFVAARHSKHWIDGEQVSEAHLKYLQ